MKLKRIFSLCAFVGLCSAQQSTPDISKQPTLYLMGYAHLDTEWRWEYPQVINEFLQKTLQDNFTLIDKYPHSIFNFSGSNRYRLMKEYHPADYERMRQFIAQGRWFPAGDSAQSAGTCRREGFFHPETDLGLRRCRGWAEFSRRYSGRDSL